jgi:hypothetical protein
MNRVLTLPPRESKQGKETISSDRRILGKEDQTSPLEESVLIDLGGIEMRKDLV